MLYQVLAENLETFLARQRRKDRFVPGFVELMREDPWLAGVLAASVTGRIATGSQAGRRVATGGDRVDPDQMESLSSERCVQVSGFSVHANVALPARDRARLERLIRYMARPPLAAERLERLPDSRVVYEFKQPRRDGTSRVVFGPLEFLEKLVALVPKPRANTVRYHGVMAPAAKWRPEVNPGSGICGAGNERFGIASCRNDRTNRHAGTRGAAPTELCLGVTASADCAGSIGTPPRSRMDLNPPRRAIPRPRVPTDPLIRSV